MRCRLRAVAARPAGTGRTRRRRYALAGSLLSLGAPLGLLGIRRVSRRIRQLSRSALVGELATDPTGYAYVGLSTAVAFTTFGYVLGRSADRLEALAETDALTGLCNTRGLHKRLAGEVGRARRYSVPLSLVLFDLDGLKGINDQEGHSAGDLAIRGVAAAIRAELRVSDVGARWGGDEFAIVAPNTDRIAAVAMAERIRAHIADGRAVRPLTCSCGVASIDGGDNASPLDAAGLMRVADAALYEAKGRGGNTTVVRGGRSADNAEAAFTLPPWSGYRQQIMEFK